MDYSIYIASIAATTSSNDSRLRLRILPHMADTSTFTIESLPLWPCFFRTDVLTGKVGDMLWVIAAKDFSIGYVLGYVNSFSWSDSYEKSSIPEDLYEAISDAHIDLKGQALLFSDIIVTYWDMETIHFISKETGAHYIAFRNGTLHIVSSNEIVCKVADSILQINSGEINISSAVIRISGEVRLGTNPKGRVLVGDLLGKNGQASAEVWA